ARSIGAVRIPVENARGSRSSARGRGDSRGDADRLSTIGVVPDPTSRAQQLATSTGCRIIYRCFSNLEAVPGSGLARSSARMTPACGRGVEERAASAARRIVRITGMPVFRFALPTVILLVATAAQAGQRLDAIKRRGILTCGVDPVVAGFAEVDAQGRYRGMDVDVCRAIAAAIFSAPDRVRFVKVSSVGEFLGSSDIDVVSRRLTWELQREGPLGLLFGPIT